VKEYTGSLLFPERLDLDYLDDSKIKMGSYEFAGQYQQRPSPDEGGVFKRWWWRYWVPRGKLAEYKPIVHKMTDGSEFNAIIVELPKSFDRRINSWDMSFKDKKENDYVVGGHWARHLDDKYKIEQERGQWDFVKTRDKVEYLHGKSGRPAAVYVEDKANGPAVISSLKRKIPGIIPVEPQGSKVARAMPYSVEVENGNVYIPHPDFKNWVKDFIDEHAVFPMGLHDDMVDESSQAIDKLVTAERVWPNYNPERTLKDLKPVKRYFQIIWPNISERSTVTFSALYMDKDYSVSGLFTIWNMSDRKLYVHHEFVLRNPTAEIMAPMIKQWGLPNKGSRVFGSKNLFGDGKTTSNLLAKYKARITESSDYDEQGAVLVANKMFKLDMIIVHTQCPIFDRQVLTWEIKKGKPQQMGVGLCKCLALIMSSLRKQGKLQPVQVPPPYSKYRQVAKERLGKVKTMGKPGKSHMDHLLG